MEITMIGSDCAKITLTADECRELDISYESFSPDSLTARLFLASVLARLESLGAEVGSADKLTAEVFEGESGGLVMYLSGKGLKVPRESKGTPLLCRTADEVIRTASGLQGDWELYRLGENFAFVERCDSSIRAAKIKEHGRMLSDAPVERLKQLFT